MGANICCQQDQFETISTVNSGHLLMRGVADEHWQLMWCVLQRAIDTPILHISSTNGLNQTSKIKVGGCARALPFATCRLGDCQKYADARPQGFVLRTVEREVVGEREHLHYFDARSAEALKVWLCAFEAATQCDIGDIGAVTMGEVSPVTTLGVGAKPSLAGGCTRIGDGSPIRALVSGGMKSTMSKSSDLDAGSPVAIAETPLSIIIFGATGDLARKKLYPALHQLMFGCPDAPLIPRTTRIVGYGRSEVDLSAFLEKQCANVKGPSRDAFLSQCCFFAGAYDKEESYSKLNAYLSTLEGGGKANRIFFFSVPPTIFGEVCRHVKAKAVAPGDGFTRLIIEKPFGRDSASFAELNKVTAASFPEEQLYRIDHYLGKEVVLNLTTLRFGNQMFEAIWNKDHIAHVQIVFKEDLGTGGRGGYFDNFGIIRDIMQNHLLQVLLWLAMEPPEALDREHVAIEKVRLLQAIESIMMKDCFLGQFGRNSWTSHGETHTEPGYLDDETVPSGSTCPTYAAVALHIDNDRWRGVPFMMRAGKGLDERMAEVRITFKSKSFNSLVAGGANELVMRIQPEEAIYLKCMNKAPGWQKDMAVPVVLDMSYSNAFPGSYVADAYERMFLNTYNGDGSLFVGAGELTEAWRIFTPLLHEIEEKKPQPVIYPFGVRAPQGVDVFEKQYGIVTGESWQEYLSLRGKTLDGVKDLFAQLDIDKNGTIEGQELKAFARRFFDGREPTDKQLAKMMDRLDRDGDGKLTFEEVMMSVEQLASHTQPDCKKDHDRTTATAS